MPLPLPLPDILVVLMILDNFTRADDSEHFERVISLGEDRKLFPELVKYLKMCRRKVRKEKVDTALAYALAKVGNISELKELVER